MFGNVLFWLGLAVSLGIGFLYFRDHAGHEYPQHQVFAGGNAGLTKASFASQRPIFHLPRRPQTFLSKSR